MGVKQGGLLVRDVVRAQLLHEGSKVSLLLTVRPIQRWAGEGQADPPGCRFPPAVVPGSFLGAQELPCQQIPQTLSAQPGRQQSPNPDTSHPMASTSCFSTIGPLTMPAIG